MVRTTAAKLMIGATAAALLAGCSTMSRLEGTEPGTKLAIKDVASSDLPRDEDLASKATGQHIFMATGPDGKKMYGLLPLRVNGGTMAGSILLFAPALFIGGFRDVFPYYQVDPANNVLRYKLKSQDEWRQYQPLEAETRRAKAYFEPSGTPK